MQMSQQDLRDPAAAASKIVCAFKISRDSGRQSVGRLVGLASQPQCCCCCCCPQPAIGYGGSVGICLASARLAETIRLAPQSSLLSCSRLAIGSTRFGSRNWRCFEVGRLSASQAYRARRRSSVLASCRWCCHKCCKQLLASPRSSAATSRGV